MGRQQRHRDRLCSSPHPRETVGAPPPQVRIAQQWRSGAHAPRCPELKRVVVATGTEDSFRIAMEPQFEAALDVIFGLRASTLPGAAAFVPPTSESGSEEEPAAQPPAEPTPAPDTGTTAPQPAGEPTDLLGQLQQTQQQLNALSALIEDLIRLQQQELAGE